MIEKAVKIISKSNPGVHIHAVPGHFATSHAHSNYYIDITQAKLSHQMAREAAITLAADYDYMKVVDTIVALDGSQIISAFLARHLTRNERFVINNQKNIYVVTPEHNASGQLIFRDNTQPMIRDKNVLLMFDAVASGKSAARALECMEYYGGRIVGIAAIFSMFDEIDGIRVSHLFGQADIPAYQALDYHECSQCKEGVKLDALANSYGYSVL